MMQEYVHQMKKLVEEEIDQVHTAVPGKITSFDPATCTASVLPAGKFKKPDGGSMDYPEVHNVPVVIPQASGQKATIAFPVKEGDGCLLILTEQALDAWRTGAESQAELKYDLTNGVAIPGLFSAANPVMAEACSSGSVIISTTQARITVSDQNIALRGDVSIEGNLTITGTVSASGDVSAGSTSVQNHVHGGVESGADKTGRPE